MRLIYSFILAGLFTSLTYGAKLEAAVSFPGHDNGCYAKTENNLTARCGADHDGSYGTALASFYWNRDEHSYVFLGMLHTTVARDHRDHEDDPVRSAYAATITEFADLHYGSVTVTNYFDRDTETIYVYDDTYSLVATLGPRESVSIPFRKADVITLRAAHQAGPDREDYVSFARVVLKASY